MRPVKQLKWLARMAIVIAATPAHGQLMLLPAETESCVFAGNARPIAVTFSNAGNNHFDGEINARILQASSATVVPIGTVKWKQVEVPAHAVVRDAARLDFPSVIARTTFLVQWLAETNRVVGKTAVQVYPTNLLLALGPMAGATNFGMLDPDNQLKPLLKAQGIRFADLGENDVAGFAGRLVVLGPFLSKAKEPDQLAARVEEIAKRNVAVVWLQPPVAPSDKIVPSFYSVQKSRTAVVIVQPPLVADLPENPRSQLNLVYFCQLALDPQAMPLPELSP